MLERATRRPTSLCGPRSLKAALKTLKECLAYVQRFPNCGARPAGGVVGPRGAQVVCVRDIIHFGHFSVIDILSSAKSGIPFFFFAYVVFAKIFIKIIQVYIIHMYVCMYV
jgi:hypothetical protein